MSVNESAFICTLNSPHRDAVKVLHDYGVCLFHGMMYFKGHELATAERPERASERATERVTERVTRERESEGEGKREYFALKSKKSLKVERTFQLR